MADVVATARKSFFDSAAVTKLVDAGTRRVLSKVGAFVRRRARSSIRARKRPSAPGDPPSSHEGSLKRLLFFAYDFDRRSVVVGPVRFRTGGGVVPGVLERGGAVSVTEEQLSGGKWIKKGVKAPRSGRPTRTLKRPVAARPYMAPALRAELPKFRDQLRGLMR